ncbi:glycosyltransferase family 4 protein [Pantoea sp. B65]|uniref:glycosyltransferase family 4 protein n=1 Tax=Pantoea sp. B65 TaxID=2813359 RepID=UPI0039B5859C
MKVILGTDPIKFPLTGIGRYTCELAHGLMQQAEIEELWFLHGRTLQHQLPRQQESHPFPRGMAMTQRLQKNRLAAELYRLTAPWLKTQVLRKHPDAIYHGPNFYLPPGVDHCVATFHDLSVFTWPQCHPPERVRFMQKELLQTIKRAAVLITDSEFTRREVAQYFNLPLTKVFCASLASSEEFYPRQAAGVSQVIAGYGLTFNQYCLFTGSVEPRKNIETLLNAYEKLPPALRLTVPLVIIGFSGWGSEALHYRFQHAQAAGWLHYAGYVNAADLPCLFAGARSFLFPSLYEGFGLPVLEAMASGVPVVCSDSASLPEIVGDCALMCAAKDVEQLSQLIQRSIEDEAWREHASASGLARSRLFSWQRCAQQTLHAYRQA